MFAEFTSVVLVCGSGGSVCTVGGVLVVITSSVPNKVASSTGGLVRLLHRGKRSIALLGVTLSSDNFSGVSGEARHVCLCNVTQC